MYHVINIIQIYVSSNSNRNTCINYKHYNYFFIDFYVRFKMTKFEYLYPGLYIYQYISHAGMQLRADAIECSSQD